MTAIDGKALRRPFRAADRSPLHPARALPAESGPLPGQVRVDGGPDGTTAAPALPELQGRTVTADAMHRRRVTARRVTEAGGGHLPALNGSQGTVHDDVRIHPGTRGTRKGCILPMTRTGTREASVRHDGGSLRDLHDRPGPPAVGKVTATRVTRGERSTKTRRSLPVGRPGPGRFLKTVRPRRAAGNSPHRVLDVTMGEDRRRNRTASGPDSLAPMRRPAADVARVAPGKDAMRGRPGRRAGATTPWPGWSAPLSALDQRRRNPEAIALHPAQCVDRS